MLDKTEGALQNIQFRETGHITHKRRRETKQKTQHNIFRTPVNVKIMFS